MLKSHTSSADYIVEIDSLRAIAVIFVIVFHAFKDILPGGFIGVDIFFTISGFVIARRYLFPLMSGEAKISSFFLARLRRLGPALILVGTLTTLAVGVILLPDRLAAYGWSLTAQPLYMQNFVFWWEGDYFDKALTRPLLHTWSLAVEEQFYLFMVVMILLLRRIPSLLFWFIIIAIVFSFFIGILIEPRSPKTAFFLLPTRIWQFALGIAAVLLLAHLPKYGRTSKWSGLAGLGVVAMIAASVLFSESASFPGPQSLIACGGAALALIASERASGAASMAWLRIKPMLYVGRISYGLYLWHWPPLSLWYIQTGQVAPPWTALMLMTIATIGAVLSYHLVEQPLRDRTWLPHSRQIVIMTLVASATFAGAGLTLGATGGLLMRYNSELRPFFDAPNQRGTVRCGKVFSALNPSAQICSIAEGDSRGDGVLILGDSHADVLKEAIAQIGENLGRDIFLTTRNCELGSYGRDKFCSHKVFDDVISDAKMHGVNEIFAITLWQTNTFTVESLTKDITELTEAGFRTSLFHNVPQDPSYDPRLRAQKAILRGSLELSGVTRTHHMEQNASIRSMINDVVSNLPEGSVRTFDLADPLCPTEICLYHIDGVPLYFDSNHLTFSGARVVTPLLREALSVAKE